MNALAIPIVHPSYENLKRMGRLLHFTAGLLILLNAIHELQQPKLNLLYFWCQLLIVQISLLWPLRTVTWHRIYLK